MRHAVKFKFILLTTLLATLSAGLVNAQSAKPAPAKPQSIQSNGLPEASSLPAPEPKRPVRNLDLYSTTVELLSQSEASRNAANARALVQVVNQLTGQTNAGSNPVVRGAMANATRWVKTSEQNAGPSDSEGNTLVGGTPVLKASLRVSFDPNPVDSLIAAAGYTYWTGDRPKPMLWLSIDDGRGPRLITAKQLNVIKSLADRGTQRGIRFLVPKGTEQELAAVPYVVSLNAKALEPFTARYGNDTMLIGKVYRSQSGWSAWWLLWQNGVELARWPVTEPDARQVIATGADNTANYFAKRDATRLDAGKSGEVAMEVQSVDTTEDFARLMAFLQNHASIRDVEVVGVRADTIALRVDLKSGINAFRGLMRSGSVLQPLGPTFNTNSPSTTDDPNNTLNTIEHFSLNK